MSVEWSKGNTIALYSTPYSYMPSARSRVMVIALSIS